MKYTRLLVAIGLLACGSVRAQHIEIGLNGGFGSTWLFNKNVSDQDDRLNYAASQGGMGGLNAGYYLASNFGVEIELNYATHNQKYTGNYEAVGQTPAYSNKATDHLSYFEIPVMARIGKTGFFFEAGPKFSFLMNAKEDFSNTLLPAADYTGQDVKEGFKSMMISGVFGLGGSFGITDNIFVNARLRFSYGFTDATKEYSEAELILLPAETNLGVADWGAHTKQDQSYGYESTHAATGMLILGISYRIVTGGY